MAAPLLSICVPTYNRADLLDYLLGSLRSLERLAFPFEIVVSDNASSDDTPRVLERWAKEMPYLRSTRQTRIVDPVSNFFNAMRHGTGELLVYAADDDSLIPEALMKHARRMVQEPALQVLYTDLIAYDDERSVELHRYAQYPQPVVFDPQNPLALVNFVFQYQVYPECGIYRREAFYRCPIVKYGRIPFHYWMYRLARQGRVAFELEPFYREHRVLKSRFQRTHWSNMDIAQQYIGDELRTALENMVLQALQDSGAAQVPPDQVLTLKQMIDQFLYRRITLEIQRAIERKNWILGVELRRRLVLWYGAGNQQEQDARFLTFPASLQHVAETFTSLTGVQSVSLHGFKTSVVADFFRAHYPQIPLAVAAPGAGGQLLLHKTAGNDSQQALPGYHLNLEHLLQTYRVTMGVNPAEL